MSEKDIIYYKATPTLQRFHADDSPVRLVMGPVGCFDADTEYLTPEGWRRFGDGTAPLVMQYDPETEAVAFVAPLEWQEGRDQLMEIEADGVTQVVTPNHRVALLRETGVSFGSADTIKRTESIRLPLAGFRCDVESPLNYGPELLALQMLLVLGARWGNCATTRLNCCATTTRRDRFELLKAAFTLAGYQHSAKWVDDEGMGVVRARMPWRVETAQAAWWMVDRPRAHKMLEALELWQGDEPLETRDRRLVDWLQFAAVLTGRSSQAAYVNGAWRVTLSREQATRAARPKIRRLEGVHPVYCCTVPGGALVVRRNGRVFISGNSGKTVGCLAELMHRAVQTPPCKDGVRRSRALVGRRTYPQLKSTTINTFKEWYGQRGTWKYESPIKWTFEAPLDDGTRIHAEVLFMSLDGPVLTVEDKLKSLELTFAYLNEASELPLEIINAVRSRLTRYPRKADLPDGVKPFFGLWMDSNPPSIRSWVFEIFEIERPRGWKMFRQPGALLLTEDGEYVPNPEAENIENLTAGYDYYLNMLPGMPEAKVRSLVLGEYSPDISGKPVYPMFRAREHVAGDDLKPFGRAVLIIGCDWGLNPAAVVTMMTPQGSLWVLDELVPKGVTFDEFRDEHLLPLLYRKYRQYPVLIVGDPAGTARNAAWKETVFTNLRERGLPAMPAPTNDINTRIQAVSHFLNKRNGLLLSPSCVTLREGFEGGYHFQRTSKIGEVFAEKPEKNEYSHPHDALQYAALYYYKDIVGDAQRLAREERKRRKAALRDGNLKPKALV